MEIAENAGGFLEKCCLFFYLQPAERGRAAAVVPAHALTRVGGDLEPRWPPTASLSTGNKTPNV